jgi:hypothetical protein
MTFERAYLRLHANNVPNGLIKSVNRREHVNRENLKTSLLQIGTISFNVRSEV